MLTPVKQTARELARGDWIISTSTELCNCLKGHAQENVAPISREGSSSRILVVDHLDRPNVCHDFLANGYTPRIHVAPAHSGQSANTFYEGKDCYLINNSLFY